MKPRLLTATVAGIALFLCATGLDADQWPRFRGPNGSRVAQSRALPVALGPGSNVVWKVGVPAGNSSPILTQSRVFLTAFEGEKLLVLCLDRSTGEELWRRSTVASRTERRSGGNDAATPTPVTDGDNVCAIFADFGLISLDAEGRERWRTPLGPFSAPHGMASSPILADDKVVLVADLADGSYIAAFDRDTGRLSWKTERGNFVGGYSTPIVLQPKDTRSRRSWRSTPRCRAECQVRPASSCTRRGPPRRIARGRAEALAASGRYHAKAIAQHVAGAQGPWCSEAGPSGVGVTSERRARGR